jgi:uncharacterized protein (DUF2147 family)
MSREARRWVPFLIGDIMKIALIALSLLAASSAALAQASPVGLWKTIDDDSGKEKSLVRIVDNGGVVSGKIEKFLDPSTKPDAKCEKCTDERKDQPVLGMTFLRNLHEDPSDKGTWEKGDILDPNNGKVYRAKIKPIDGGKKLQVRGYIGPFYRTQIWLRVE